MPTTRGTKSKSHSGLDYETRKGSKFYNRNHHLIKPYRQKAQRDGGFLPLLFGALSAANALRGLFGKGKKKKGGARKGYAVKGPITQRGFY